MRTDLHQHLWGERFVTALRARTRPPRLDGWTLHLDGEPPYEMTPADHDPQRRAAQARADGVDRVLVSLSAPLGIEWLPAEQARPLLDAHHDDTLALPRGVFGGWAAAGVREIDPVRAAKDLDRGFAGLQLPATALLDGSGYQRCAPLLDLLEQRDLPLFVHPGAALTSNHGEPRWWAPVVPYVQQTHAAWFAFRAYGRPRHRRLRVCFAALGGLAPLHGERLAARGGGRGEVDRGVFVETSSYGPRAVDSVVRALGVDAVVYGSDRPYAGPPEPPDFGLGEAALRALLRTNPRRLLQPSRPTD